MKHVGSLNHEGCAWCNIDPHALSWLLRSWSQYIWWVVLLTLQWEHNWIQKTYIEYRLVEHLELQFVKKKKNTFIETICCIMFYYKLLILGRLLLGHAIFKTAYYCGYLVTHSAHSGLLGSMLYIRHTVKTWYTEDHRTKVNFIWKSYCNFKWLMPKTGFWGKRPPFLRAKSVNVKKITMKCINWLCYGLRKPSIS